MSHKRDLEVLSHIFNPLLPSGELEYSDDIPEDLQENAEEIMADRETQLAKELELKGIKGAEAGNLPIALDYFTQAIEISPNRASGYNNRAQVHRLLGNTDGAKMDLNNAINISEGKGKAGGQAFCQRGLLYLRENRKEDAKADFEAAAKLGSQFAKAQLVQMNPYAAMCNAMLRDMALKLQTGESEYYNNDEPNCKQ